MGSVAGSITAFVTAVAGIVGAVVAALQYTSYRRKRDRKATVGQFFRDTVAGLATHDEVHRLSSAVLLRRFFDPDSEYGDADLPYAEDTVRVIAAVLRTEPTGHLQKLLADGLRRAPSLARFDLQKANLRDAFLAHDEDDAPLDLTEADLFGADLSYASLRRATARETQFKQARLIGTVLKDADLTDANLQGADLDGAALAGATIEGASFAGARHVPEVVQAMLDDDLKGRPGRVPDAAPEPIGRSTTLFLSAPTGLSTSQQAFLQVVADALERVGAAVERIGRSSYSASAPLPQIVERMRRCQGVVVIAFSQLEVADGRLRPGTADEAPVADLALPTPWNQIEAGMAAALGLPMLVFRDTTRSGLLDLGAEGPELAFIDVGLTWDLSDLRDQVGRWVDAVRERAASSTRGAGDRT